MKYTVKTTSGVLKLYAGPAGITISIAEEGRPEAHATFNGLGNFDELFGAMAEARRHQVAEIRERQSLAAVPPLPPGALLPREPGAPPVTSVPPVEAAQATSARMKMIREAARTAPGATHEERPFEHEPTPVEVTAVHGEGDEEMSCSLEDLDSYAHDIAHKFALDPETDVENVEVILFEAVRESLGAASRAVVGGCPTRATTGSPCAACSNASARVEALMSEVDHDDGGETA